jgi:hypothetical protein
MVLSDLKKVRKFRADSIGDDYFSSGGKITMGHIGMQGNMKFGAKSFVGNTIFEVQGDSIFLSQK